jgi:hypothetical protein
MCITPTGKLFRMLEPTFYSCREIFSDLAPVQVRRMHMHVSAQ